MRVLVVEDEEVSATSSATSWPSSVTTPVLVRSAEAALGTLVNAAARRDHPRHQSARDERPRLPAAAPDPRVRRCPSSPSPASPPRARRASACAWAPSTSWASRCRSIASGGADVPGAARAHPPPRSRAAAARRAAPRAPRADRLPGAHRGVQGHGVGRRLRRAVGHRDEGPLGRHAGRGRRGEAALHAARRRRPRSRSSRSSSGSTRDGDAFSFVNLPRRGPPPQRPRPAPAPP